MRRQQRLEVTDCTAHVENIVNAPGNKVNIMLLRIIVLSDLLWKKWIQAIDGNVVPSNVGQGVGFSRVPYPIIQQIMKMIDYDLFVTQPCSCGKNLIKNYFEIR
jgi:hypothetical protein